MRVVFMWCMEVYLGDAGRYGFKPWKQEFTTFSTVSEISMITASSSSEGGSSVSIWLSSNFESKKCTDLLSIRSFSNERFPTRWRYKTGRFNSEIKFRYFCLRAEHETTTSLDSFSKAPRMVENHPFLSWSFKGMPSPILTLFSRGWKSSPSRNGHPRRSARAEPIVLFPHPETPMTTITGFGKAMWTGMYSRSCIAV